MTCPDCEYHKQRAALWRHEAYRLGGTPLPWDADEAIAKAVAAEQEACARAASIALLGADKSLSDRVLNAIRARGKDCAPLGEQFMHITDGIYEENGEIKSGTIPDHIVQADKVRSAPATRAYYANAIERANQFTESLRQERLKREAGESGDE